MPCRRCFSARQEYLPITNYAKADASDIIFWRGAAGALLTVIYLLVRGRLITELRAFSKTALAVTLMSAAGTAAFIPASKFSSVASVCLIYSVSPFITATMAWLYFAESPSRTVMIASAGAVAGVSIPASH